MDLGIAGRRAAVAAASGGLGLATAKALAAEGVLVAICGRDKARIDDAAAEIGHGCIALVHDVGSAAGGVAFVEDAIAALGGVDILVTNAGGPPRGSFFEATLDQYEPALELNLLSVVGMCTAAVPAMQAQHWGRIVAITSYAVRQPLPELILSNTARAGATGFLKTLANAVAPHGITVNSAQPGRHETERVRHLYGDAAAEGIPTGTLGDPDDFGAIIAFMCSEQAKFLTGAQVHVDGGAYFGLL